VLEAAGQLGLAQEPPQAVRVGVATGLEPLERGHPSEIHLPGPVHPPHPAAADLLEQFVPSDDPHDRTVAENGAGTVVCTRARAR
jgi:hypothetical protein